ncbi:XRE family transcriptional regulator [Oleiagrimonas soli]|uniref:Transcriptional regulator with XRE-family HTH domain n=1 Tax=Oleiagrimonas soli TaxID=1543381 RepID=A0A099CUN6_9GAMM|nr:XRE family transcriptional regulator [Oleiagrimonas soli]KGI77643.1 XRE family transcriptional regulator [Oleiagrimonas soli]MBB6182856.1 transcriptional regulator with XRE-family HTH domain [Oleiagrimonas soli]
MQFKPDGAKIKRWREERCWSQEHLAEAAGIGLRTVQRIENGDKASRESVMALAAAFNVDVMALTVDPGTQAADQRFAESEKGVAAFRLSFWIHLASYVFGVILFMGINLGVGSFVMRWPLIWWTVAVAGHGLGVVIATLVIRFQRMQRGVSK